MSEEQADAEELSILRELILLAEKGFNVEVLQRCDRLALLVLGESAQGVMPPAVRGALVREALEAVVSEHREIAIREIGQDSRAREKIRDHFRVAASAELLGMTDESVFREVRKVREGQLDEPWQVIAAKPDNKRSFRARRRTRAAYWLGDTSARGVKDKEESLLAALESAVVLYFADNEKAASFRERIASLAESLPSNVAVESPNEGERDNPQVADASGSRKVRVSTKVVPYVEAGLRDIIGTFAERVLSGLEAEHRDREVSSPIPIRVRWATADPHLADRVENILQTRHAVSELVLDGDIDEIAERFHQLPSRRLVILGRGGAGKTVLATELAIAMLQPPMRTAVDAPVPFVFSLANWDPSNEKLFPWMISRLEMLFPDLKRRGNGELSAASRLVNGHHIIPVLDGFDEIDPEVRKTALSELNGTLRRGQSFVMTSRREEFEAALGDLGDSLHFAAAVELQDLTIDDLAEYLPRTSPQQATQTENRWDSVLTKLSEEADSEDSQRVLGVLSTPLMVWLARSLYSRGDANPEELLDGNKFPSRTALEDHLISGFVEIKYGAGLSGEKTGEFGKDDTVRWLGYIAARLFAFREDSFAWWLSRSRTESVLGGVVAFSLLLPIFGVLYASVEKFADRPVVLSASLVAWIMIMMSATLGSTTAPARLTLPRLKALWRILRPVGQDFTSRWSNIIVTVLVACAFAATYLFLPAKVSSYILLQPALGLPFALFIWMTSAPDVRTGVSPRSLLQSDLGGAAIRACIAGAAYAVITLALFRATANDQWLVALPILVLTSFCAAFLASSSMWWLIGSSWLALIGRGPAPWKYSMFFEEAYSKGFLRQVGGSFQFRHSSLQFYFADAGGSGANGPGGRLFRAMTAVNTATVAFATGDAERLSTAEHVIRKFIAREVSQGGFRSRELFMMWALLVHVVSERHGLERAQEEIREFEVSYKKWIADMRTFKFGMRFARARRIMDSHDRVVIEWSNLFRESLEKRKLG